MSNERLKAIVLRRINYAEADRILWLLTPKGRRNVIAKGVRKQRSKLAGGIELFAICDVVIRAGKSDLGLLTSARAVTFYRRILENYERMSFAYTAMKLIAKSSEMIDEPEWFNILADSLAALDDLKINQKVIETWFYVQYASIIGEELNLHNDAAGLQLDADKIYMYDQSESALRLSEQGNIGSEHIKLLRLMQQKPLSVIIRISGVDSVIVDSWLLIRQHLAL